MNILDVFEYNQHFVAMMNIINSARLNPPEEGQKHHIIPRCWFRMNNLNVDNSDENLVLLSKEQHCKVHKLMSLCAKDEQLKRNMVLAAQFMGLPATSLKYTPTDETRKKISEAKKGQIVSEESRKKLSESKKGKVTWIKGKHHTDETRIKMSKAHKGRTSPRKGVTLSEETRIKISEAHKGRTFTEEHCRNLSESHKGQVPWNKGKHHTEETRIKDV